MAELYANVDGQMVPLTDCTWVFSRACGHPYGVLVAVIPGRGGRTYATEEEAWRDMYPRARDRQRRQQRGHTARLATRTALGDEFWEHMKRDCACEVKEQSHA